MIVKLIASFGCGTRRSRMRAPPLMANIVGSTTGIVQ
jgi:hypothetical protein